MSQKKQHPSNGETYSTESTPLQGSDHPGRVRAVTTPSPQPHQYQQLRPTSKSGRSTSTGMGEQLYASRNQPIRISDSHDLDRQFAQGHSPCHYIPSGRMYVCYEEEEARTRGSLKTDVPLSFPCKDNSYQNDTKSAMMSRDPTNTFIGEIDGQYSINNNEEFVRVEINTDTTSTSHELMACKKTVLKPYLVFLKVIGWRRFQKKELDMNHNKCQLLMNILYPSFIFLMLAATIVIQSFTCFFRTRPAYYKTNTSQHLHVECTEHILTVHVVPNLLILLSFLYGLYIFRFGEPENLAALMETVFLSTFQQTSINKKRIIRVLRSYLVFGSLWILLDFILSIMRIYSLQLLDEDTFNPALRIPHDREFNSTTTHNEKEKIVRFVLVLILPFGFALFDLLYFAVVVAYTSQSQLIQYYITSIMEKVRTKAYSLKDAIKDIRQAYIYLQVLNSKLSTLMTMMLILFIGSVITSSYHLADFPKKDKFQNNPIFYIGAVVGFGNILQWSALAATPIIQAARLTSRCRQLRRLGLEIGSRPFVYTSTPQLDLSYFLQYTNSTRYTAKLATVPVYPWMVVGSLFFGGIIGCFVIAAINNPFEFASWF